MIDVLGSTDIQKFEQWRNRLPTTSLEQNERDDTTVTISVKVDLDAIILGSSHMESAWGSCTELDERSLLTITLTKDQQHRGAKSIHI